MALGISKDELLKITGEITFSDIISAIEYLEKNKVKPRGETSYFVKNGEKIGYSFNQIIKTINNDIRQNKTIINTHDIATFEVGKIFEDLSIPNNYQIISPWNENGKKLINKIREDVIEYAKSLGYELNNNPRDYTALKYLNRNFAEIHYPDKHSKIRVDVFFDKLPQEFRKSIGERLKRYPDTHGYSLNGKYDITLDPITINQIKQIFKYLFDHHDEILNKYDTKNVAENDFNNKESKKLVSKPDKIYKNQILYGPPGTGKTYNTVVEAIKILDKNLYLEYEKSEKGCDDYKKLKDRFDVLKNEEKRIEFITFHQSYSYEEFVEGIKPDLDNSDVKYQLKDGVFKKICDRAKPVKTDGETHKKIDFDNAKVYKMSLGDSTNKDEADIFEYCIENNCIALGYTNVDFTNYKDIDTLKQAYKDTGINEINTFRLKMDEAKGKDRIVIVSNGNNYVRAIARIKDGEDGNYYYKSEAETGISYAHFRNVDWLYIGENIDVSKIYNKKFSQKSAYELTNDLLNKDFINDIITGDINTQNPEPYILIIDEINRGNISKIFGELITLIEEDKRGKLKVRLPYSQDEFTVPENLYIIGTMNTSDRSIASVDIALRRRFKFKEMMPNSALVHDFGCGFVEMFTTLNKKITILLDRDHQIGHSYFVKDKHVGEGITKLQTIWFDSVLPLLNEYFYGDWEKLQEILGEAENEEDKKDGENYTSFIKKLSCKDMKTSCYDSESDCFDFVREDEIDFEKALENAFSKKKDDNKS